MFQSKEDHYCFLHTMSWLVVLLKEKLFGDVAHVWKQFFL